MKRSFILFCGLLGLLTASCESNEENPPGRPSLKITQDEVVAEAFAERYWFTYELAGAVAGGTLEASSEADWLSGWDYGVEGTVSFQVAENDTGAERQASIVLTYTYGADKSCSATVEICQEPAGGPAEYDYEFRAPCFHGSFTADIFGLSGEDNYNTWLSDKEFTISPLPGVTYYRFDIFAPAPDDREHIVLTPGTYRLGVTGETKEFTFSPEYSEAFTMSEDGTMRVMQAYFTEGTLEVTEENGHFVLEAVLTDHNSLTHHVVYRGEAEYNDPLSDSESQYTPIERDLDFKVRNMSVGYMSGSEDSYMNLKFQLSDMEATPDGQLLPPGVLLTVDAYVPYALTGEIASGTYGFDRMAPEPFSLVAGTVDGPYIDGTNAMDIDADSRMSLGLVSSGTMTISSDNGVYRIECDFRTAEDVSVKALYEGPIEGIVGLPGPISTLKGDYTLNLDGDLGVARYFGNMYGTGGVWKIQLLPPAGTTGRDGVMLEIVSGVQDFTAGIPAGVYRAPAGAVPLAGEYLEGMLDGGNIMGTMYLGGFTPEGSVSALAPATDGDLNISREDNGDYTFSFSFKDDIGNTWDGNWCGPVQLENASEFGSSAMQRVLRIGKWGPERFSVASSAAVPARSRTFPRGL